MKRKTIKIVALITLLTIGGFACTKDGNTDDEMILNAVYQQIIMKCET